MRDVWQLIRFTRAYFWACTFFGAVLFCVLPLTIGLAAEALFDSLSGRASVTVWTAIVVLGVLQSCEVLADLAIGRTWSGFSYKSHVLLQRNMFAGILRGYGRHGLPVPPGDAINRFRDEPPTITSGSMDGVCDLIGRGLFAIVAFAVMWQIDPTLAIAAFVPVLLAASIADALGTRASRYGAEARESSTRLSAFLGDVVNAQLAIRVAGAAPRVVDRLRSGGDLRRRLSLRDRLFSESLNSMNVHLVHVATGAVLLLGASDLASGTFTVGEFALFVIYLDQLTYLPAEIGRVITELKRTAVAIDRMHALMPCEPRDAVVAPAPVYLRERPPSAAAEPDRVPLERLEVRRLTYRHPSSGRGIEDVSFTIERGTITVVTGRVGAGKSTLLHALLGLVTPQSGEVAWNGQPIDDPASFLVPPQAAFTPQVPRLFSETVADNVRLGVHANGERIARATHAAVLERDVGTFTDGLATLVGPRGVKLSGGQIQRVAAARMFLREPELLVFDDLSSALDRETEAQLWARLFSREAEVTSLVVSHSPIALARADQVLTLEDGRLVRRAEE